MVDTLKRSTRQKPVYTQVVEQIRQSIKQGDLTPGDQLLPERELADTFGVSRTSVRQALGVLEGMGIIEVTPRAGAYVCQRSLEGAVAPLTQILYHEREQVTHLFEVRRIIETQAACLAAERCLKRDIKHLRALNQAFERGLRTGDLAYEANIHFHLGIVRTAKNPLLIDIMGPILTATVEVYAMARRRSLASMANLLKFVNEHELIIEALAQHDPVLAADLVAKHIDDARKRVEMILGEDLVKGA